MTLTRIVGFRNSVGIFLMSYAHFAQITLGVNEIMGTKLLNPNDFEVDAFYDQFMEIIVNGRGYQGIADLLAKKCQTSILIEDEFFRVLARSNNNETTFTHIKKREGKKYLKPQRVDPRIINYVHLAQSSGQPIELPELPDYGVTYPRQIFPFVIKNKIKGYLHVFIKELDWNQMRLIKAALHSLVFLVTLRHAQVELKDEMRRTLILGLINDKGKDDIIQWEKGILGLDLSREMVLAVIQIKNATGQQQIEDVLFSITSDLDLNANVIAVNDEQAVLLVQSTDGRKLESSVVTEYLQVIFEALKITFTQCKVKIGVGRQCFYPRDYRVAFAEACKVISFTGPQPGTEEGVFYYHSLRLMGILPQPGNDQTLSEFVRRIIGKLYEYGVEHNTNLIETLACYLEQDCCIQSAARELFIHPSTLRYRLEKAEKISGLDLKDKDTKLELLLAIKLYRYYGETLLKR
ncbi:Purine catabolism regulatory protein [Pelotomaculum schinkii]|uniref:Purine catabolism regulatory protein n=2 Tax=Pelotomaculum schinkii TaxID=78350 RepID=A0A4Y7RAQ9_9FIRM|nr:Purine catabolism regulatory protein [Pelotomaculum schinkii]